ncbi:hypothetical protein ACJZ2D_000717 [Fusarium nematophilum]
MSAQAITGSGQWAVWAPEISPPQRKSPLPLWLPDLQTHSSEPTQAGLRWRSILKPPLIRAWPTGKPFGAPPFPARPSTHSWRDCDMWQAASDGDKRECLGGNNFDCCTVAVTD